MRQIFISFGEDNYGDFNLTYEMEPTLSNSNGDLVLGQTGSIDNIEIKLNGSLLDDRSPLEIAKMILHESVHAILRKHYATGQESFVELFGEYMREFNGSNDITHAIMRDNYITQITTALKQFDNNQENDEVYENLAWEGLHQFLSQEEINNIIDTREQVRERGLNCN